MDVLQPGTETCTGCGCTVVVLDLGDDGVELLCECSCSEALV